jgi:hypothetical protein
MDGRSKKEARRAALQDMKEKAAKMANKESILADEKPW